MEKRSRSRRGGLAIRSRENPAGSRNCKGFFAHENPTTAAFRGAR